MMQLVDTFRSLSQTIMSSSGLKSEILGPDILLIHPKPSQGQKKTKTQALRDIDLCLLAGVHGNEVGGVQVLIEILESIVKSGPSDISICFALGNPEALRANKRFIGQDLNRSFGRQSLSGPVDKRARFLETIFLRSHFLLDLHQTQEASETAFFISRFHEESFKVSRIFFPKIPFVTYKSSTLSLTGMTTLNFHLSRGGMGLALELGEKGLDPGQIQLGIHVVSEIIKHLRHSEDTWHTRFPDIHLDNNYTFSESLITESGTYELCKNFSNFAKIKKNEKIARIDEKDFYAHRDSLVLFPKGTLRAPPGSEVIRLLKPLDF